MAHLENAHKRGKQANKLQHHSRCPAENTYMHRKKQRFKNTHVWNTSRHIFPQSYVLITLHFSVISCQKSHRRAPCFLCRYFLLSNAKPRKMWRPPIRFGLRVNDNGLHQSEFDQTVFIFTPLNSLYTYRLFISLDLNKDIKSIKPHMPLSQRTRSISMGVLQNANKWNSQSNRTDET